MLNEAAREQMIHQQVRAWDVLDPRTLEVLGKVPREQFVPAAFQDLAFADAAIPLPHGERMLAPKVAGRILQALQVTNGESVLEIGTGSGFMAALLAHRAQQVLTLECEPDLARLARASLLRNGLANVRVIDVTADAGAHGLAAEAPFDVILLSGSVPEVPRELLQQLKPGGRLATVVGDEPVMRARLFKRVGDAAWSETDLFDTVAPRLLGFAEPTRFHF